jgi:hypothetical protein
VYGALQGKVVDVKGQKRFKFSWKGNDECDPASGRGWVQLTDNYSMKGEFSLSQGDDSTFLAKRAK